jgi:hypothetical protein
MRISASRDIWRDANVKLLAHAYPFSEGLGAFRCQTRKCDVFEEG